jgi:CheY-like chemotaxis protein
MADKPVILIADDDWMNREVMQTFFEHSNFNVLVAQDGDEALRLTREHMPDIALLDVRMRGLTGYDVCAKIKSDAATRHIVVVVITALERDKDREHAVAARADAFVPKSMDWSAILERIEGLLTGKNGQ